LDLDVLGVQEVQDVGTLKRFVIDNLASLYEHVVLVGNDPRLIDAFYLEPSLFEPLRGTNAAPTIPA
jgi:hypothetical protein